MTDWVESDMAEYILVSIFGMILGMMISALVMEAAGLVR